MILAIDVHYRLNFAKSVGVVFQRNSEEIIDTFIVYVDKVQAYESGKFYKRELPCVLELLRQVDLNQIDIIIIDGYVYIDNKHTNGLGAYLYFALEKEIPIIGVAKNTLKNNHKTVVEVYRGESKKPLFVSSVGMDIDKAVKIIKKMNGAYRIPIMLKNVDRLTKKD